MMNDELNVLKIVTTRLHQADIPYMVSGSMAANFYGYPRMTRDIDIIVELVREDVPKVYQLFESDFYIDATMIHEAISYHSIFNIIHNEAMVKVDFIIRQDTPYRRLEFNRRCLMQIDDFEVFVVALEDLILSKLYWVKDSQSELHLNDVKILIRENRNQLNENYLNKWANQLQITHLLEELL
ncbi:nucleotidyltransferase family protein [Candidatus Poribacteria bacterium]|nr:nucleotidyltransferase family protein [Candidatus Poribacteria bacterium]